MARDDGNAVEEFSLKKLRDHHSSLSSSDELGQREAKMRRLKSRE